MTLIQVILLVGLATVALDSRTTLLAARGGMASDMAARPFLVVLLGGLSLPAQIAILVAGFFVFAWYFWVGAIAIALLFLARLVNPSTFTTFYSISPLLNLIAIAAAVVFWGDYFKVFEI